MVRKEWLSRRPVLLGGVALVLLVGTQAHRSMGAQGAATVAGAGEPAGAKAPALHEMGGIAIAGVFAGADLSAGAHKAQVEASAPQTMGEARDGQGGMPDAEEIRRHAREAAEQARQAAAQAREAARLALRDIDVEGIAAQARAAASQLAGPPRLGVSLRDVTDEEARAAKLDAIAGAWVTSVSDGSAADAAGLAQGDLIVKADGEAVRSARHLTRVVAETPAGRPFRLTYIRNGQHADVTVTLAARTPRDFTLERAFPEGFPFGRDRPGAPMMMQRGSRLGVSVQALTPQLASYFGVSEGVLVTEVRDGTPAARGGVKAGDVITKVGEQTVARPADVTRALSAAEAGSSVTVLVTRDRQSLTLEVTLDTLPSRLGTPGRVRPSVVV